MGSYRGTGGRPEAPQLALGMLLGATRMAMAAAASVRAWLGPLPTCTTTAKRW